MIELIKVKVAKHFCIEPNEVVSNTEIRHVYIYLLCENTKLTLKNIAAEVGKKDHSTIISARDKVRGFIELKAKNKLDKKSLAMVDKVEEIQKEIDAEKTADDAETIQRDIDEEVRLLKLRKQRIAMLISENPNMADHLTIELCAIDDILSLRRVIIK